METLAGALEDILASYDLTDIDASTLRAALAAYREGPK
jgi:hypothetical protein